MSKERKAIPVTLSRQQHRELERLWFIYGNYGPKQTPGNHSFIQGLLEHAVDLRPLFTKRTPKYQKPTPECEAAVERVLAVENGLDDTPEAVDARKSSLRIVRPTAQGRPPVDAKLKLLLDDMNRRYRVKREGLEMDSDPPDAA